MSRGAIDVLVQRASVVRGGSVGAAFSVWDGGWYGRIAAAGYGFVNSDGQTPYPFFPLLPWLLRAAEALGLPPTATGVALNHLAFLIALWGVYDIARAHGTFAEAALASWCLAFYPGSAALTLIYPCAIYLACCVWGFRALERGREGIAATLAAGAAMVRPNGIVLAASLTFAALRSGSWRRAAVVGLPATACVTAWMLRLWSQTGDPLIFLHAKDAWHEVTLASFLAGSTDAIPKLDLAALAFAPVVLASAWRRLPPEWLVFAALALLPSLAFGIVGMPRFTAACFPVSVAGGILLARLPAAARVVTLVASASALLVVAWRVLVAHQVP